MGNERITRKQNREKLIRRRRARIVVLVLVLLFVFVGFLATRIIAAMPYESVDLCNFATIEFGGYNTAGTAMVEPDEVVIDALLAKVKQDCNDAIFHNSTPNEEDYLKFKQSLGFSIDKQAGLANGSVITMNCTYDKKLAKSLKIEVTNVSRQVTVGGLPTVTTISKEQLFENLEVSFSGVSPNLMVYMSNNSTNPFISKVGFAIVEPKDYYANGDVIRVRANFSDGLTQETNCIVDTPMEECIKEFTVECDSEYITKSVDLPANILAEAVDAGKRAFVDANEYGVRIYCEANLVPVYINKKATFVYGTPKYVSSYFKSIRPDKVGTMGYDYNDLDIIYSVVISQADGVTCTAYAAVRFMNIIKNADGSYEYDFSDPKILTESYFSDRVKKNVTDNYVNTHEVERVYAN